MDDFLLGMAAGLSIAIITMVTICIKHDGYRN